MAYTHSFFFSPTFLFVSQRQNLIQKIVPTTAGTGSETTGTAIFDYEPLHVKTGIANRKLRPTLGIVDPLNTRTMPSQVKIASGLDVLCHALESYTALPYNERSPRPANPAERPAYQGSNPISDIWSLEALRLTVKYLARSAKDPLDMEANTQMCLAASAAGTGFGSAGVHVSRLLHFLPWKLALSGDGMCIAVRYFFFFLFFSTVG